MDHKNSTRAALNKYFEKQLRSSKPKRKNAKPEKQVEKQVREWCQQSGWFVSVVESKAVYSKGADLYLNSQAAVGFPDLCGLMPDGTFVAIELKSPGRRSTLRESQRCFLNKCIALNGFAVVVDSTTLLESSYQAWLTSTNKKETLSAMMPKQKEESTAHLFD